MKKLLCSLLCVVALYGVDKEANKKLVEDIIQKELLEKESMLPELMKKLGKEHPDIIKSYDDIAGYYAYFKNYEKAIEYYKKSISLMEKTLGKEHIDLADKYETVFVLYSKLMNKEKAGEYYRKAEYIRDKNLKNKQNNENFLKEYQAKSKQSTKNRINKLETELPVIEQSQDFSKIIKSYNDLALHYQTSQNYQKALEYYNKSIVLIEKTLGKEHIDLAKIYDSMANIYNNLMNKEKQLEFLLKALNARKDILNQIQSTNDIIDDENSLYIPAMGLSENYNSIASTYETLGDLEKAVEYYEKANELGRRIKSMFFNETDKITLGEIYAKLGKHQKALEIHHEYLEENKNFYGEEHENTALAYMVLASSYKNANNIDKSQEYYNKALKIFENKLEKGADISYYNLCIIYSEMQNNKKALECYLKELEKTNNLSDNEEGFYFAEIYYKPIIDLSYKVGDYKLFFKYAKKSYDIYKKSRDINFGFLSDKEKKNFVDKNKAWIESLLVSANAYFSTLDDKGKKNTELFDIWINDKGALLDNENAIAMLKSLSKDKAILDLIARLENYKREYAALSAKTTEPNEAQAYQAKLKELDNQISNTEKELGKHATSIQNALDIKDIKTADVAGYLKDNELFIDFGYFGKEYYAFSVDSKGAVEFKALDKKDAGILDDKIKAFRDSVYKIIDNKESDITSSNENAKKELESIYKLVFEKALANRADSYDSLIISGDGMLRLLPFEALRFNDKYLIESKNIRYASSAKEFVRAHKFNNAENSSTLSVFSDPDYDKTGNEKAINIDDSASTRALGRAGVFSRLRGFKIEADAIQEQASGEVKMYSRADANEINLFAQKSPKILHIITHGIFINDENIINPMLKSGIALSGANTENKEGVVMALKLSGLSLKGTDMVVLSACETGVIDPKDTSAAAALPKTFIQAGAKNVMMSLWKVDDAHTVRLMKEFYADTSKGNYNELLRNSKLQMIKEGIHPYYWAGFIISGE